MQSCQQTTEVMRTLLFNFITVFIKPHSICEYVITVLFLLHIQCYLHDNCKKLGGHFLLGHPVHDCHACISFAVSDTYNLMCGGIVNKPTSERILKIG